MTCYVREATIVLSTGTAARKLRALSPSSDMKELVDDTLETLDAISSVDVESVCGEAWHGPKDTKACTGALGDLFAGYYTLGKVLDEWKPYT